MPECRALQRREVLCESLGISVVDFRCRASVEPEGPEEPNATHSIVFVRRGVFRRTYRGETLVADPTHVLFFNAAEPYRYAHPLPGGDECTILAIDDALAELTDEAVRAAYRAREPRAESQPPPVAVRRARDMVEVAKLAVNELVASPPSLGELARRFDCSPFHLSRTFHRVAGVSLRRYIGRLRASVAAERLAADADDLTALALDLGYADHSHFTNAFRQEWGLPPSQFRARVRAR